MVKISFAISAALATQIGTMGGPACLAGTHLRILWCVVFFGFKTEMTNFLPNTSLMRWASFTWWTNWEPLAIFQTALLWDCCSGWSSQKEYQLQDQWAWAAPPRGAHGPLWGAEVAGTICTFSCEPAEHCCVCHNFQICVLYSECLGCKGDWHWTEWHPYWGQARWELDVGHKWRRFDPGGCGVTQFEDTIWEVAHGAGRQRTKGIASKLLGK